MLEQRGCGVLLHPTSLPGKGGMGCLGADAYRFIDILSAMGMSYWQVLPLTPPAYGHSPYSSYSAFAGNPLLLDSEQVARDVGSLFRSEPEAADGAKVDFKMVAEIRFKKLRQAAVRFLADEKSPLRQDFWDFCDTTPWLHNYALFMALKKSFKGRSWHMWPSEYALLDSSAYEEASVRLGAEIGIQKFMQWQFFRQWKSLKSYANQKGIKVIGDIPIFVAYDSVDVWSRRELFLLDKAGKALFVAGVPPDYFSSCGQLWGNPLYNWQVMEKDNFAWWGERFSFMLETYDIVRVDHFRGFEAAWHVPASEITAVNGEWVKAPGEALFDRLTSIFGAMPLIAEDLGVITDEVLALRDRYNFPGMKILQFAFDSGASNAYLPHNQTKNSVVYSGTHDNDTLAGWCSSLTVQQQRHIECYFGCTADKTAEALLRSVLMSVANTAILPLQDILSLGSHARMNVPGTASGNWAWRFGWEMLSEELIEFFSGLVELYGRGRNSPQ